MGGINVAVFVKLNEWPAGGASTQLIKGKLMTLSFSDLIHFLVAVVLVLRGVVDR